MSKLTTPVRLTLADKARARQAATLPGPKCGVTKAMAAHPDLADEIKELISDRSFSDATAADEAADAGIAGLSENVISHHRLNKCIGCRKSGYVW